MVSLAFMIGEDCAMATKAKTKANRSAERKSGRAKAANRKKEQAQVNAFDVLEQDHREVEEWFDEYDELTDSEDDRKAELAEKICSAL
jgi:hypothetical protein